jgi:molecular chaperone GrpE
MWNKRNQNNSAGPDDISEESSNGHDSDPNEVVNGADEMSVESDSDLDDSVVAEENAAETIKKLREKLKKAEAEKQEYLTGWQRAKADMINARKRDESDRKDFIKFANENLISELIPVLDSFDMAMGNKEAWEKADKNWRIGVEYIYSQLKKVLADNGVKEINPLNEKYDHSKHEAIAHVPVSDEKLHDVVVEVVQRGYELNGKELKAPRVKVGEFRKE